MIACIDVDYRTGHAIAACVLFNDWHDPLAVSEHTARISPIQPYVSGEFYRRELPCILKVLESVSSPLDVIVIDGYVWLDGGTKQGLGAHLYEALGRNTPVVGVAKTPFATAKHIEITRGTDSTRPLYITAAGISASQAADCIRAMSGTSRVPDLIKRADKLARSA
jgi:deoxyribonuclease V